MYQSVDERQDAKGAKVSTRSLWPRVTVGLLAGVAAFAFVYATMPETLNLRIGPENDPMVESEARRAYLRSISEQDAALRRARLTDFLTQYSQHALAKPTRAQLAVLDTAESRDWQDVLTLAMDPQVRVETSLNALRDFEDLWGGYLGGRDRDIEELEAELKARPFAPEQPDRSLPETRGNYPAGVPGAELVGGGEDGVERRPAQAVDGNRYRTVRSGNAATDEAVDLTEDTAPATSVTVEARVRRDVEPRYPRSALRRDIGARIVLTLRIDENGRVQETTVISSEADRYEDDFINAAERAARRTTFFPKTVDGEPVDTPAYRRAYRFEP